MRGTTHNDYVLGADNVSWLVLRIGARRARLRETYHANGCVLYTREIRVTYEHPFFTLLPHVPCAACQRPAAAHTPMGRCLFGSTHYVPVDGSATHTFAALPLLLHARRRRADTVILGIENDPGREARRGDALSVDF